MCFCKASIWGLLTMSTLMVLPASDLSKNGSAANVPEPPELLPVAPDDAGELLPAAPDDAGELLPAAPDDAGELLPAAPDDAGELLPAAPDDAGELLPAAPDDAGELFPAAVDVPAAADVVAAAEDDDAVPVELLLHDAVTSIVAQPAAIAALCVQRMWKGSFR